MAFRLEQGFRPDLVVFGQDEDPAAGIARLRDGAEFAGFFQSELWFADFADEIRRLFTVRAEHQDDFRRRFPELGPYICMHVRRTDYLDMPPGWALPASYFTDALAEIPDRDRFKLIVVSDDPDTVRADLAGEPEVHFSDNPPIVDLQLLMNAHFVITSNSSFSWWGAWLNQTPQPLVIAPQHWLGFASGADEPVKVLPERWMVLPVRDPPLRRSDVPAAR